MSVRWCNHTSSRWCEYAGCRPPQPTTHAVIYGDGGRLQHPLCDEHALPKYHPPRSRIVKVKVAA